MAPSHQWLALLKRKGRQTRYEYIFTGTQMLKFTRMPQTKKTLYGSDDRPGIVNDLSSSVIAIMEGIQAVAKG